MLKNIIKYFKKLKEDLNKIKKYQYNITSDIRYLMKSLKKTITSHYIEYESKGDNNDNLLLEEYLNIFKRHD